MLGAACLKKSLVAQILLQRGGRERLDLAERLDQRVDDPTLIADGAF